MNRRLVKTICQRHNALLLDINQQRVQIAVAGNPSAELLETLRFASQQQVEVERWSVEKLEKQQQVYYQAELAMQAGSAALSPALAGNAVVGNAMSGHAVTDDIFADHALTGNRFTGNSTLPDTAIASPATAISTTASSTTPISTTAISTTASTAIQAVEQILQQALQQRASDIHVEPDERGCRIRLRVDGVLQVIPPVAVSVTGLIARLKVLANLDIAEHRLPQDGQFSLSLLGQNVSFRLATLSCRWGEKAVIRLLQQPQQALDTDALGMSEIQQQHFRQALQRPQGLILVTGPTGSGKTITLYSALSQLNRPQVNICTVEDPIEIPLPGLNQTQVNPKAGLHFQTVLRALLRQDPDIIMVGEIRDGETAEIALKAAQTGHLVLSTLHTTSTAETLTRLEQMGAARWLLASALELIIAQRLVRRLCPHCRSRQQKPYSLPAGGTLPHWHAKGCERCYGGYYGRLALFELLPVNDALRQSVIDGLCAQQIEQQARQQGMMTLFEHGCCAVEQGLTSIQELWRVLGTPHS